ncbi:MAG TPA: NYN domain-containing protein [Longimicrobiales bacterium]
MTPAQGAPNAALLIDFDNVTMGIRSDLSKELKKLLNSDIIKGKVAVQRAYADWRRYPQYIVPLAEAAVDLIFAPAYGSSKKNATDIRLAIDALELVFTRPEIGVFILLSGDSDFSSLVLKLKEYGKYVIGVGIRESSSDLLVQNCDEYYSYSALTGLTRAGEDTPSASEDPWVLVERAVRQMAENRDVMRSDRLKQVLLELDPNFDERTLGFSKFSKFVAEAATRGCLRLRKLENGQYEVLPAETEEVVEEPAPSARREEAGARRGRREERSRRERGGEPAAVAAAPEAAAESAAPQPAGPAAATDALRAAYDLLRRAVEDLTRRSGEAVRDSDVKRRMLELQPGWDESALGFSKFSRFLRQAHDVEVVDLRKADNGTYEVALATSRSWSALPVGGAAEQPASSRDHGPAAEQPRSRRSRRDRERAAAAPAVAAEAGDEARAAEPAPSSAAEAGAPAAQPTAAEAAAAPAQPATAPLPAGARITTLGIPVPGVLRFRRGTRGRAFAPVAPPPLLAGQTVPAPEELNGAGPAEDAGTPPQAAGDAPAAAPAAEGRQGRGRKSGRAARSKSAPAAAAAEAAGQEAAAAPAASAQPPADEFPVDAAAVIERLSRIKGVGKRTAEALVEALGAANVFPALRNDPDSVRAALGGGRRAELLIRAWKAESGGGATQVGAAASPAAAGMATPSEAAASDATSAAAASEATAGATAAGEAAAPAADDAARSASTGRRRSRGRRGGQRSGRRSRPSEKKSQPVPAGGD